MIFTQSSWTSCFRLLHWREKRDGEVVGLDWFQRKKRFALDHISKKWDITASKSLRRSLTKSLEGKGSNFPISLSALNIFLYFFNTYQNTHKKRRLEVSGGVCWSVELIVDLTTVMMMTGTPIFLLCALYFYFLSLSLHGGRVACIMSYWVFVTSVELRRRKNTHRPPHQ